MRLYLVQHGKAQPKDVDPERRLTEEGVRELQRVAAFLRPLHLSVDAVWHSGKARARQTAEILAAAFSGPKELIQREGLAPSDPVATVPGAIAQTGGDLAIVGHLPFLNKLAALLVSGSEATQIAAFQNGGVVCLEESGAAWRVLWMLVPDLLPEL